MADDIFQGKPGDTVTLTHQFLDTDDDPIQADGDVKIEITDRLGFVVVPDTVVTFAPSPPTYSFSYVIPVNAVLGTQIILWKGDFSGDESIEEAEILIIMATEEDLLKRLNRPSSVSAFGVTASYSQCLRDSLMQRPVMVGKITKMRRDPPLRVRRDYNRFGGSGSF